VPQPLFVFVQIEFPWALGPPDGRYLMRAGAGGPPERVVVVQTASGGDAPAPARTTRITVIDPVSLSAEQQARAWLKDFERDRERGIGEAIALVNRVLYLHRLAAADARVHEVSPAQALAVRAGWGEGEQLASGRWEHAQEQPARTPARRGGLLRRGSRRERASELTHSERLAALLGAREEPLVCEELALRSRGDLEAGRLAHAALELQGALAAGLAELRAEERHDLALRIDELKQLSGGVTEQARVAIGGEPPDAEVLAHALDRLQAALRARQLRL
jgi:hypothetical protein